MASAQETKDVKAMEEAALATYLAIRKAKKAGLSAVAAFALATQGTDLPKTSQIKQANTHSLHRSALRVCRRPRRARRQHVLCGGKEGRGAPRAKAADTEHHREPLVVGRRW